MERQRRLLKPARTEMNGTFLGLKLNPLDDQRLMNFCQETGMPNQIGIQSLHLTIMLSGVTLPHVAHGPVVTPIRPIGIVELTTRDGKRVGALAVDCPFAVQRRLELTERFGINDTISNDNFGVLLKYFPHITLSYDLED